MVSTLTKISFLIIGMLIAFGIDKFKQYKVGTIIYFMRDDKITYGLQIDKKRLEHAHLFNNVTLRVCELDKRVYQKLKEINVEDVLHDIYADDKKVNKEEMR